MLCSDRVDVRADSSNRPDQLIAGNTAHLNVRDQDVQPAVQLLGDGDRIAHLGGGMDLKPGLLQHAFDKPTHGRIFVYHQDCLDAAQRDSVEFQR